MLSELQHFAAERIIKPCSEIRGTGRVARILNQWFLRLGANPIVTARMREWSRLKVDLRSGTGLFAFWSGVYDPVWFSALRVGRVQRPRLLGAKIASLGGNILDVGANIGFFTIAVGEKLRSEHKTIFTFEPVAANFARLLEHVRLNNLQTRVSAYPLGLSDCSGEAAITLREDFQSGANTGNASIAISSEADQGFSMEKVTLDTLDTFARRIPIENVSVVKVDIEGLEHRFLAGARETLGRHRPVILLEFEQGLLSVARRGLQRSSHGKYSRGLCAAS